MALRRELLKVALLAAALLALLPAAAMATPRWLAGETRDAAGAGVAPDVAAVGDRYAAIWVAADAHVYVAERPRGGPWGAPEDIDPAGNAFLAPPKIVALGSGELVAAWVLDSGSSSPFPSSVVAARRAPGGAWSAPQTISSTCCPALGDLVAGADGTAIAFWTSGDGSPESAAKPPDSATFDAAQGLPDGSSGTELAVAPDGSALVAEPCSASASCLEVVFRPVDGTWGTPEPVPGTSRNLNALAVAAKPDGSGFTVVWSQDANVGRSQNPPGELLSRDRGAGAGGAFGTTQTVTTSTVNTVGCPTSFGCLDLAVAGDGTLAAVWQQGPAVPSIAASLRSPGAPWGPVEMVDGAPGGDAFPRAAFTAGGSAVAAWVAGTDVRAARRSGSDGWTAQSIGAAAPGVSGPSMLEDVVGDAAGDAATAWADSARVETAGFDAAPPRFSAFSLPSGTGEAPFSAVADDNWSPPASITWLFGDGAGAPGASVSHAYGAVGTFTATATATDAVGNATELSGPVVVTATPTADPCGTTDRDKDGIKDACDKNDGSRRPVAFKTVNATVVSGDVFVKLPAGQASAAAAKPPKGFVRLQGAETIPVGSTLDTAKGRVKLRSASDTRKHVQSGQFFRGRFVVRQVRKPRGRAKRRSTKLITVLTLSGSSFSKACRAKASTSAKRRSRKRVRRLFGDAKGAFRTKGRNAAATVRGTRWSVQDRCDGTLVTVQRGRVSVRDLVTHRTVLVKTGHTYLARLR
jgi:hypothetical protein